MTGAMARIIAPFIAATILAGCTATGSQVAPSAPGNPPPPRPILAHVTTLTTALSRMSHGYQQFAESAPGPQDVLGYHVGELWKEGIDGTGTTIALIEGWDDPQIKDVIQQFDQQYGLPDPEIHTIYPSGDGHLPAHCPPKMVALGSYGSCEAWQDELRLDVEAAHLIAPYARILISATPADSEISDDAASQVAPPEMMRALEFIAKNHLADAISISDGTGESTYSHGKAEITAQDPGPLAAAAAGIPVLVATGDCGVVQNLAVASSQCGSTTTVPDTAVWDDSPWVTAVGGSVPELDNQGRRAGPDPSWHHGKFSGGAGYSSVYPRPAYQDRVGSRRHSTMRSVPDITMDARSGTSEAAPLFGGVLALAAQLNRGSIGPINQVLYDMVGPRGASAGIADVISGNNSVHTAVVRVPGFSAAPGFDVVSGWGTIDASRFVPALVASIRTQGQPTSLQRRAGDALERLQHGIRLTSTEIAPGHPASVLMSGFLPQHPVELDVDNRKVAILTADGTGTVSYRIDPASHTLAEGGHALTLKSMLLTATAPFRIRTG
jgi:subtilase family serine protease